jgi:hypothetical protein
MSDGPHADTSEWGFTKGQVAKTLREILYPGLTDHQVEVIVVCLLSHLLVESKLNGLLHRWLMQDAPGSSDRAVTEKAEDTKTLWKLNDLRNDLFHGREIGEAKFLGQLISEESTAEQIFLSAQPLSDKFDTFEEMVDAPHALADKWRRRLTELGEQT